MSQFENKINNSNVKNEELKDIIKKMENKVLTA